MNCEMCGHVFSQKHRIVPGAWGGTYRENNVIHLCPNHHSAIHFLMVRWLRRQALDPERFAAYRADKPLWKFWKKRVRPVCVDRKAALKRIRKTGRQAQRKVNGMTPDQFLRLIASIRSWHPPLGVCADIFHVDSREFRISVLFIVHNEGRNLVIEDYRSEEDMHKFFEDLTNEIAGRDLRAEVHNCFGRKRESS